MVEQHLVVAVDGGGSKTRALTGIIELPRSLSSKAAETALGHACSSPTFSASVTILSSANAGPGNARSVGFELAQANIKEAIDLSIQAARNTLLQEKYAKQFSLLTKDAPISAACLSLAGVGRESDRLRMKHWGHNAALAKQVIVTTDADPLLAFLNYQRTPFFASADNELIGQCLAFSLESNIDAISLISGTGSFCFGTSSSGKRETCGGWGGLLGDEGGGYWIAMEGLKAVTRQADGRGETTLLTQHVLNYLGLRDATELIGLVYAPNTTRDQLAKIAGIVFALSAEDLIANNIVTESGRWLAELIKTVATKLDFLQQNTRPILGLAGGNFCNQPILLEATLNALAEMKMPIEEAIRIHEPALGGFVLAAQQLDAPLR